MLSVHDRTRPIASGMRSLGSVRAKAVVCLLLVAAVLTPAGTSPAESSLAFDDTSRSVAESSQVVTVASGAARFVPLGPTRLFDTRSGLGGVAPGIVGPDGAVTVQVAGVAGVPTKTSADVVAVALNVTATDAAAPGYVSVWPSDAPRPSASSINLTAPGQTRANLVTVALGAAGAVSLYSQSGVHLIGDIAGYYVATPSPVSAGRFVALSPSRLFDTRDSGAPAGKVAAGGSIDVVVAGAAGVPAGGASAVVLNLTAADPDGAGYVTAWPSGAERPTVSNLNVNGPGEVAPNLAIVPLGSNGNLSFYAHMGTHLLADVVGYMTADSAAVATAGLFVPIAPARVFDTRAPAPPSGMIAPGGVIEASFTGANGVPGAQSVASVVVNITATESAQPGFITAWPSNVSMPNASVLNLAAGDTRPNAAMLGVDPAGRLSFFNQPGSHLVVDISGFHLSDAASSTTTASVPKVPTLPVATTTAPPTTTATTTTTVPNSTDVETLIATIENDVLGVYGSTHPWLFDAWDEISQNGTVLVAPLDPNISGYVRSKCEASTTKLPVCTAYEMTIIPEHVENVDTIVHELAHIWERSTGVAASSAAQGMAQLYFDVTYGDVCENAESMADAMLGATKPGAGLAYYAGACPGLPDQPTAADYDVVDDVIAGIEPAWFAATYSNGTELWAAIMATAGFDRAVLVANMQDQFGGYCSVTNTMNAAFAGNGDDNPFADGGC